MANALTRIANSFKRIGSTNTIVPYFTLSEDSRMSTYAIDKTGALMSNAYMTAVQAKARSIGSLPGRVFKDGDKGRETVKDHPLTRLVRDRWNPLMTAQDGWHWTVIRRDTYGTAYVRVEYDGKGKPKHLWPLNCTVYPVWDPTATTSPLRYDVQGDDLTPKGVYLDHQIIPFKTCISTDGGITGRSLAELAATEIGLSINLTKFYSNIIGQGFSAGGVLEADHVVTPEEATAIGAANKALSGADHAGNLRIFSKGIKYTPVGQSMAEADIVKQEEFVLQSVARAVYVQPSKVMDYSRATFSNIEEANIAWVTDTILGEVTAFESALKPILEYMGDKDCYVKFELRGLLRGSFTSQMEGFRTAIMATIHTPAEVRELLDLPFMEGSDELMRPLAYYTIDPVTGEPKTPPNAKAPRNADPLASVLADARERIDKRVQRDGPSEKTQDFARTVMAPVGDAYERLGIEFDLEKEIPHA